MQKYTDEDRIIIVLTHVSFTKGNKILQAIMKKLAHVGNKWVKIKIHLLEYLCNIVMPSLGTSHNI